jgi:signal peptidase I
MEKHIWFEVMKRMDKWKKELISWIKLIVISLLIVVPLHQFGFNFTLVQGQSMQPTLIEGERLFVNRAIFLWTQPRVGEIVILKEPKFTSWSDPYLVKRVVAVAGDDVEIKAGRLYRNGLQVQEAYIDTKIEDGDYGPEQIRANHVFVMGDNRHFGSSKDSRYFGQVEVDLVVGRADFIIWPLSKLGELP